MAHREWIIFSSGTHRIYSFIGGGRWRGRARVGLRGRLHFVLGVAVGVGDRRPAVPSPSPSRLFLFRSRFVSARFRFPERRNPGISWRRGIASSYALCPKICVVCVSLLVFVFVLQFVLYFTRARCTLCPGRRASQRAM